MKMEHKVVSKPGIKVIGLKYRGKNEEGEVPKLWEQFVPRIEEIQHMTGAHDSFGVMDNYEESSGEFDYLASVRVVKIEDLPEGMDSWVVPENRYLVFTFPFGSINESYKHIFGSGFPESGYERAQGPEFEYYPEEFDPKDSNSNMMLFIPIK
jgi:AraC family transcriptional regulator